jgi:hypothetical protein
MEICNITLAGFGICKIVTYPFIFIFGLILLIAGWFFLKSMIKDFIQGMKNLWADKTALKAIMFWTGLIFFPILLLLLLVISE